MYFILLFYGTVSYNSLMSNRQLEATLSYRVFKYRLRSAVFFYIVTRCSSKWFIKFAHTLYTRYSLTISTSKSNIKEM